MTDFKQNLIEAQKYIVDQYEETLENAPLKDKRLAQEMLHMQQTILRRMGYRKPVESAAKNPPPKGFFKTKRVNEGEQPVQGFDNKNINKGAFKQKEISLDAIPEGIKNENVNTESLKANEVTKPLKAKANPKRLNPTQTADIKFHAKKGDNAKQISDKLWIAQSKVQGLLDKMNKGGILLATNKNKKTFSKD